LFYWFAKAIGKDFSREKREMIASLLFSKDTLPDGSPELFENRLLMN